MTAPGPGPAGSADAGPAAGTPDAAGAVPAGPAEPDRGRGPVARWGVRGTVVLAALAAVVLLAVGATLGVALAPQRSASAGPLGGTPSAVDVGFAQDMIVHHNQGVLLAHYGELDGTDPDTRTVAYDINYTQTAQLGQMQGWLALWGAPQVDSGTPMAWMSAGGHGGMAGMAGMSASAGATDTAAGGIDPANGVIMPGMASNADIAKLKSLRGKASDVFFLQLMIRHHQGGAVMMQYAAAHADVPTVRNFAGKMLETQSSEISVMTQMLSGMGGRPLPFTAPVLPTG
ncbi:DUF305 domain-containing protein [Nakamurella endophytica]|uniref:DUF305 domain-containing protein n=1 Tax=Nakamurella endophytica TaxID=1748367 RepID=A0A917TD03_9ACTN|nr:DUF305 domain-containing protein [Nakamurella endophytica]GGM18175.1 DUF305 domain-containing protein [Nakamurella endophytica]